MAVGLGGRTRRTQRHRRLPARAQHRHRRARADRRIRSGHQPARRFTRPAPLDRDALRELVLRFALLLRQAPQIVEADLNPVRCMSNGCSVLETRLRVERMQPTERIKTW